MTKEDCQIGIPRSEFHTSPEIALIQISADIRERETKRSNSNNSGLDIGENLSEIRSCKKLGIWKRNLFQELGMFTYEENSFFPPFCPNIYTIFYLLPK